MSRRGCDRARPRRGRPDAADRGDRARGTSGGDDTLVVYTARSHYGEEAPFERFADQERSSTDAVRRRRRRALRAAPERGAGPEGRRADHRRRREPLAGRAGRPARAGAARRRSTATCPADLRDPDGEWFGLTVRARTIMRSTERVAPTTSPPTPGSATRAGRASSACARARANTTSRSSPTGSRRTASARRRKQMLERWMANDPRDPRLRHRRAEGDRATAAATSASRTPTTSGASSRRTRTSRSRRSGPTRGAAART